MAFFVFLWYTYYLKENNEQCVSSEIVVLMFLCNYLLVCLFFIFYFFIFIYLFIFLLIGWFSDKTFKDGIWAADSRHAQATTWPFMLLRKDMKGRWLEVTSERVLSLPNSNDFCGNLEWPQHNYFFFQFVFNMIERGRLACNPDFSGSTLFLCDRYPKLLKIVEDSVVSWQVCIQL